jgi:NAD(P)-dependent dehydrogenase (short-subunit alcohol dehydrogenase family)
MARVFAAEGARIAIAGRNASTLHTASTILQKLGAEVMVVTCDVRNRDHVKFAVDETVRTYGSIDVLVNNAGVIQVGPFDKMTMDDYENAMATHAWGPLYSIMAAVPHMRRQGGGRIVNISSIGGKVPVPHLLPYVMSKFALSGLSEAIGTELDREGIHVTTVFPGLMRTGSHVNAGFKGDHKKEFAWFSLSAGFPVVSINAERAAKQIVEACRERKEQLVITPGARLAAIASGVAPNLLEWAMRWMDMLLPASGSSSSEETHSGWESRSWRSPAALTQLADAAIERNNEQRAAS